MTTISLFLVTAFLRRHNALQVLEGAPWYPAPKSHSCGLQAIRALDLPDHDEETRTDSVLYLGTGDICPAAEGWTSRVLALAHSVHLPNLVLLSSTARFVRIERDGILHEWRWDTEGNSGRLTSMSSLNPPTSAERLKMVLLYELERKP